MTDRLPSTCQRQQGRGIREEDECGVCQDPITAETYTVTHLLCGRTICDDCFNRWARTSVTCVNCRGELQNLQPRLDELRRWLAEGSALRATAYTMRVQISVASQSAADATTVFERLRNAHDVEWIGLRPNLIRDLSAAFEDLRIRRQARMEQTLKDNDDQVLDDDIYEDRAADGPTRRTRAELERRNQRNWRQEGRIARSNAECDETFDRFLAA